MKYLNGNLYKTEKIVPKELVLKYVFYVENCGNSTDFSGKNV